MNVGSEVLASAAVIAALLAGCSTTAYTPEHPASGGEIPQFSGPHAAQIAEHYREAESDFFREVIADEKVTEAEFLESAERNKQCLIDQGFTGIIFHKDGTSQYDVRTDISEEEESQLSVQCAEESGYIYTSIWYFTLTANPDNIDWKTAERDCLVNAGVLEPGTSVEEVAEWHDSGAYLAHQHQAYICSKDPLGKLGVK